MRAWYLVLATFVVGGLWCGSLVWYPSTASVSNDQQAMTKANDTAIEAWVGAMKACNNEIERLQYDFLNGALTPQLARKLGREALRNYASEVVQIPTAGCDPRLARCLDDLRCRLVQISVNIENTEDVPLSVLRSRLKVVIESEQALRTLAVNELGYPSE